MSRITSKKLRWALTGLAIVCAAAAALYFFCCPRSRENVVANFVCESGLIESIENSMSVLAAYREGAAPKDQAKLSADVQKLKDSLTGVNNIIVKGLSENRRLVWGVSTVKTFSHDESEGFIGRSRDLAIRQCPTKITSSQSAEAAVRAILAVVETEERGRASRP